MTFNNICTALHPDDSYFRWQLLNTMTMKWLDLTIQQVRRLGGGGKARGADAWGLLQGGRGCKYQPKRNQTKGVLHMYGKRLVVGSARSYLAS